LSELAGRVSSSMLMDILQELFEQGLITYHRTDSFTVSEAGIKLAEQIISEDFSRELFHPRRYPSEGAHECIRITKRLKTEEIRLWIELGKVSFSNPKQSLFVYDAIYKRFLASQMKPTKVLKKRLRLELAFNTFEWELVDSIVEHGFDLILPFKVQHLENEPIVASVDIKLVPNPFHAGKPHKTDAGEGPWETVYVREDRAESARERIHSSKRRVLVRHCTWTSIFFMAERALSQLRQ